jgi:Xaa-Pro aminopeptidase
LIDCKVSFMAQEQIDAVRAWLDSAGAAAFYVRDTANIEWLSGFEGTFDEERAHAVVIDAAGAAALHTDSRYVQAVAAQNAATGGLFDVSDARVTHAKWAHDLLVSKNAECAIADPIALEDTIDLGEFRKLEAEFAGVTFTETHNVLVQMRAVKTDAEIAKLRAAQAITDAAFSQVIALIKPGMTELELMRELDNLMFAHGAEGLAFPTIIACGQNGASPHARPGTARLEAGMCVVMDFGAKRAGYCSDMTRTVFLGEPQGEMLSAWEAIRSANEAVEQALCPGMTGVWAHQMAEDILTKAGFEGKMGHGLGHGVGLEIHEEPCLNLRNKAPLAPGNVVTVEPGIYLPGKFGMRLEDFGVITDSGFEVFTQTTHNTIIL